jgi:hypothetical protein
MRPARGRSRFAIACRPEPCRHGALIPRTASSRTIRASPTRRIATILAWVDGGAPKGDDKDMPEMPSFTDGWTIGEPDAVFEMKEAYQIPATGVIEYQYIRIR